MDAGVDAEPGADTDTDAGEARYLDACVADAEAWLGTELTAYLAGAGSPAELGRWLSDGEGPTPPAASRRLRAASDVVEIFAVAGHGTHAQAWLREVAPVAGGQSPAQIIRYARSEQVLDQVCAAAERDLRAPASR